MKSHLLIVTLFGLAAAVSAVSVMATIPPV
jgi:hypothetical protein